MVCCKYICMIMYKVYCVCFCVLVHMCVHMCVCVCVYDVFWPCLPSHSSLLTLLRSSPHPPNFISSFIFLVIHQIQFVLLCSHGYGVIHWNTFNL